MLSFSSFTVITITHNRDAHLQRVLDGIALSDCVPSEVIVVYMNQPDAVNCSKTVPVRSVHISSDNGLPLAQARALGVKTAATDNLIFLDVDCIPASDMFSEVLSTRNFPSSLVMGTPRYLGPGANTNDISDQALMNQSVEHKGRENIQSGVQRNYESFWSLCFGLTKQTYRTIGGFDESFSGYGGEDTDFAFMARKNNVPYVVSGATCFHQHHAIYKPPVQHVEDIVKNSRLFHQKWGIWPMKGWLQAFTDLGYMKWSDSNDDIQIVRLPDAGDKERFKDTISPY